MILETERLILRPWTTEDAEDLYEFAKDPDVGPVAGWPAHSSLSFSKAVILTALSAPETYALELKSCGRVAGSLGIKFETGEGIDLKEGEAEIGYWIGKPYWGQGLVPEALKEIIRYCREDLKLSKLWCGYYEGNGKSRRVMQKCGFADAYVYENSYVPLLKEYRTLYVTSLDL